MSKFRNWVIDNLKSKRDNISLEDYDLEDGTRAMWVMDFLSTDKALEIFSKYETEILAECSRDDFCISVTKEDKNLDDIKLQMLYVAIESILLSGAELELKGTV